jgi:hypothetical protein
MRTYRIFRANLAVAMVFLAACAISCKQDKPDPATNPVKAEVVPAPVTPAKPAPAPVAPAAVANAAGTWKWTTDPGGSPVAHSAVLTQDGEKLTGKFIDSFDDTTHDIKEGRITKDGQITLIVVRPFMDAGTMNFKFVGKLDGNTIKGTVDFGPGDESMHAEWNAKRGS